MNHFKLQLNWHYKTVSGNSVIIVSQNPYGGFNGEMCRNGTWFWCWWDETGQTYQPDNNIQGCPYPSKGWYDLDQDQTLLEENENLKQNLESLQKNYEILRHDYAVLCKDLVPLFKIRLKYLELQQENVPKEFEEVFRKHFKDLLA